MAEFLLINPAYRLFGEHFNLRFDMRADIHIRASISAHMPWKIKMANVSDDFRGDIDVVWAIPAWK